MSDVTGESALEPFAVASMFEAKAKPWPQLKFFYCGSSSAFVRAQRRRTKGARKPLFLSKQFH
jgi:hypothetical protein